MQIVTSGIVAITTDEQHEQYLKELQQLIELDPDVGTEACARLILLSDVTEKYENERWPLVGIGLISCRDLEVLWGYGVEAGDTGQGLHDVDGTLEQVDTMGGRHANRDLNGR